LVLDIPGFTLIIEGMTVQEKIEHERKVRFYLAQADDLKKQLLQAWEALGYYSNMDYQSAIEHYEELKNAERDS
jgi:hypothetical protein